MIRLLAFIAGYAINYTISRLYGIKIVLVFILGGMVPFVLFKLGQWSMTRWPDVDPGLVFVSVFAFILFGGFALAIWYTRTHDEYGRPKKKTKGSGGTGAV